MCGVATKPRAITIGSTVHHKEERFHRSAKFKFFLLHFSSSGGHDLMFGTKVTCSGQENLQSKLK